MDTKKCKYCKTEIDKKAKICPNCKKKQSGKVLPVVVAIIVILIIAGAINGGKDNSDTSIPASSQPAQSAQSDNKSKPTEKAKPTEKPIEYTKYKVSELMDDLSTNAMKAEKKYTDQYVEITGKLFNIDSDGKYIDLGPSKDEYTIIGVQCYIKSDDQADKIMEMKKGQDVTLKGKITEVGEVLGYSLDIDEIE